MDQRLRDFYLDSQIKNAPPGQQLVMLYDGLIDHAERAETSLASSGNQAELSTAAQCITRSINILTELNSTLKPDENAELCRTLHNLYLFFTREFSEALDKRQPKKIRAVLPLIRELRNAWSEAYHRAGHARILVA